MLALFAQYVDRLSAPASGLTSGTTNAASARLGATEYLATLFGRYAGAEHLQRFMAACPASGAVAADYAPRELELDGTSVVAWIQFYGLDPKRAFVDISAQSAPSMDWVKLTKRVAEAFAVFSPGSLRCWLQPGEPLPQLAGLRVAQHVVGGNLAAIVTQPARQRSTASSRLSFQLDPRLTQYDAYVDLCQRLMAERPEAASYLKPEPREELRACAEAQAWLQVFVDDNPAGFIAARPGSVRGLKGWLMIEKILDKPFRQRGLGARMEWEFLCRLASTAVAQSGRRAELPIVLGTIDARNSSSLSASVRVGRRVVESSYVWPA